MNKLIFFFSFLIASSGVSWSQSTEKSVHWQKSIGGQKEDVLNDLVKDEDGNIYVVGSTQVVGSQIMDILVEKYSENGQLIWNKTIGASGDDRGIALEILNHTLYVLSSSTSSTGLFVGNTGREDVVLIQLTLDGDLKGINHFGGNYSDIPTDLTKTSNGELLLSAHSNSTEGLLSENKGQFDSWVLRLTASGSILWKQNYGGSDEDFSSRISELPNGDIVLLGQSSSFDNDITQNYGDFDLSLFKLSAQGNIIWEQNYGGLQSEEAIDLMIHNSKILIAANTQSQSFDISKNAGFSDAWVLEIDPTNGVISWEETHGSEYGDYASAISVTHSGDLVLIGTTNAPEFFGNQTSGNKDVWMARINHPNSIDHLALFGGNGTETVSTITSDSDGSFLLIGASNSNNDLFSENNGQSDAWMMKFELTETLNQLAVAISAHPNPTNGEVYLNHLNASDEIVVFNSMGQIVIDSFQATSFSASMDLSNQTPGVYLIKINRASGSELIRLVRN